MLIYLHPSLPLPLPPTRSLSRSLAMFDFFRCFDAWLLLATALEKWLINLLAVCPKSHLFIWNAHPQQIKSNGHKASERGSDVVRQMHETRTNIAVHCHQSEIVKNGVAATIKHNFSLFQKLLEVLLLL